MEKLQVNGTAIWLISILATLVLMFFGYHLLKEKNNAMSTRVHDWVLKGDIDKVREYIDDGGDVNVRHPEDGAPLLVVAVMVGENEIVKFLVNRGADVNIKRDDNRRSTPISVAALTKNHEIVDYLLANGVNPTIPNNQWAVRAAIESDDNDILMELLLHGFPPHDPEFGYNPTLLELAKSRGNLRAIEILSKFRSSEKER